jgi:hypothetical protein
MVGREGVISGMNRSAMLMIAGVASLGKSGGSLGHRTFCGILAMLV